MGPGNGGLDVWSAGSTPVRWLGLLLGLVISHSLWAVEFGSPRVLSVRGEPLQIVIPMTGISPGTETAYFPLLAPQAAFDQRGLSRAAELTRLRYRVNATGAGRAELVISTKEPWETASLSTLIEVYSPVGALLRPLSVAIPRAQRSSTSIGLETTESAVQPTIAVPTQPSVVSETAGTETPPAAPTSDASMAAMAAVVDPASTVQAASIRVTSGMTLWRVAERVRPEGLSMEQVMMALYADNPEAFEYGNVNALEKDRLLTVPSIARMAAMNPEEASRVFKAHMAAPKRDFRRSDTVQSVTDQTTPVEPVTLVPEPVVRAPVSAPVTAVVMANTEDATTPAEPVDADRPMTESLVEETRVPESPSPSDTMPSTPSVDSEVTLAAPTVPSEVIAEALLEPSTMMEDMSGAEAVTAENTMPPPEQIPDASDGVLVSRITDLESKLTEVDAKISELIQTITTPPTPSITERAFSTAIVPEAVIENPTPTWVAWLRRPEILGALAGAAFLILVLIWRTTSPATSPRRVAEVSRPAPPPQPVQPVSPERVVAVQKDPLAMAIDTVQSKLVEPHALEKTESLYRLEDEAALLAAFSADALNEHPEWGDDPDDEADLASQQLEMVQSYLDKGMREVAIELLQRVAVSPDREARTRASTWLSQLHANA